MKRLKSTPEKGCRQAARSDVNNPGFCKTPTKEIDMPLNDTDNAPDSAPSPSPAPNPSPDSAPAPVNPVSDVEVPFFIVSSKPADAPSGSPATSFANIDDATAAADALASLHPGLEIYVLEARRSALAPAPTVANKDLPQS